MSTSPDAAAKQAAEMARQGKQLGNTFSNVTKAAEAAYKAEQARLNKK